MYRITWKTEWPQWVLIAGMFILAAITWASAPDRIPVHWNIYGQADRYGDKAEGLLVLPAMSVGLYLLLAFLPRLDPGRANYERFAGAYSTIRLAVMVLLAVIYGITHLTIRGYQVDMSMVVPMAVGALFIVIGNLMGKIRPNWFVGIRTPWTLSSKTSWVRTHRLGGWLFILMGLVLIVTGVVRSQWSIVAMVAIIAGSVIWMFVYSYLVWRNDPDKLPPSGTLPE
jgi:uncharacterized membrane protein